MYYIISISQSVVVTPDVLGPNLQKYIKIKLYNKMEGHYHHKYGYILAITRYVF